MSRCAPMLLSVLESKVTGLRDPARSATTPRRNRTMGVWCCLFSDANAPVCADVLLCFDQCADLGVLLLPDPARLAARALGSPLYWDSSWCMSDGATIAWADEARRSYQCWTIWKRYLVIGCTAVQSLWHGWHLGGKVGLSPPLRLSDAPLCRYSHEKSTDCLILWWTGLGLVMPIACHPLRFTAIAPVTRCAFIGTCCSSDGAVIGHVGVLELCYLCPDQYADNWW